MDLRIKRTTGTILQQLVGVTVAKVKIDERSVLTQRFFGESSISVIAEVRDTLPILIGDWIQYDGIKYFINTIPNVTKNATNQFIYNIVFESEYYNLSKVQYMLNGAGEFDYCATLSGFIALLVTNLNRVYGAGSWTAGACTQSNVETKTLHFAQQNCRQIVQTLCTEFAGELAFWDHEIRFADKVGAVTVPALTFQYGGGLTPAQAALRGTPAGAALPGGLYSISRKTASDKNICTRLYAFGADRNLGTAYRSGKTRLEFASGGNNYLEKNVSTYGIIEHTEFFNDIYPRHTWTITSIGGSNTEFNVSGMPNAGSADDFGTDLVNYAIPRVKAKVHFQTGNLAGYEFEILSYNSTTKEFKIIPTKFGASIETYPTGSTFIPATNDTFVLLDISMPASYVSDAETELQALAQAYLDANSVPNVLYDITPDPRWMAARAITLKVGDKVTILDTELGINQLIRITELVHPLSLPYDYRITVSDFVEGTVAQKTRLAAGNAKADIGASKIADPNQMQSNWRIVVNGADNNIKLYDVSDVNTVKIDGDVGGVIWVGDSSATKSYLWNNSLELKTGEATTAFAQLYLNNDYAGNTHLIYIDSVTLTDAPGTDLIKAIVNSVSKFSVNGNGYVNAASGIETASAFYRSNVQVVGAQGAAVADATDAASVITRLNDLLARLRTHGLIAT